MLDHIYSKIVDRCKYDISKLIDDARFIASLFSRVLTNQIKCLIYGVVRFCMQQDDQGVPL
jgi:hypothetical protein